MLNAKKERTLAMVAYLDAYYYCVDGKFIHNVYRDPKTDKLYIIADEIARILRDVNGCRTNFPITGEKLSLFGTLSEIVTREGVTCEKARASSGGMFPR